MSRVGTNSNTCDIMTPPKIPAVCTIPLLLSMMSPFVYHVIVDGGLEDSVVHFIRTLFIPLAKTGRLSEILENRGGTI